MLHDVVLKVHIKHASKQVGRSPALPEYMIQQFA